MNLSSVIQWNLGIRLLNQHRYLRAPENDCLSTVATKVIDRGQVRFSGRVFNHTVD